MKTFVIAANEPGSCAVISRVDGQELADEGNVLINILASYPHQHFARHPALAAGLVQSCRHWNDG